MDGPPRLNVCASYLGRPSLTFGGLWGSCFFYRGCHFSCSAYHLSCHGEIGMVGIGFSSFSRTIWIEIFGGISESLGHLDGCPFYRGTVFARGRAYRGSFGGHLSFEVTLTFCGFIYRTY